MPRRMCLHQAEMGGEKGPGCTSLVDSGPARTKKNTPTWKGRVG